MLGVFVGAGISFAILGIFFYLILTKKTHSRPLPTRQAGALK